MTPALALAAVPLTRDGAQQAARHELARRPYQQAQPPWWLRLLRWVLHELARVWTVAAEHTGGTAGLAALILLVLLLLGLVAWRVGPRSRSVRRQDALLGSASEATAAQHRDNARRHADRQEWAEAVREQLRAISRDLEERALVDRRPGRTAYELAVEGGRALPATAPLLREAADRFVAVWYGRAEATAEDHRRLVEIDRAVRAARPARTPQAVP